MLVTMQPPSTQGQAPVPSLRLTARWEAGRLWRGTGYAGGDPVSARILAVLLTPAPAWVSTPTGTHTFNHKTRAKPVSYPLLPFVSVCGGAEHPAVPLLYLRGCGYGWMDRKGGD